MSGRRDDTHTNDESTALAVQSAGTPTAPNPDIAQTEVFPNLGDREAARLLGVQGSFTTLPFGDTHSSFNEKFAVSVANSIGPRDGLEALLALQMVRTHNLAMHYLELAAKKNQTPHGIELFTKSANLLLRTFTKEVEALKTYRSKGEQKVEVEHVHVHRGGQAIVGPVSHTVSGGGE